MKRIGIDIGTTSICAVVMDSESGTLVDSATEANRTTMASSDVDGSLQDPDAIWEIVQTLLDELLRRHSDIMAIGVTGQMHGILYVDVDGHAVSPLFTWQDQRGNQILSGDVTYADALGHATGYTVASGYGLVTYFYHVCTHTVPTGAARICTIGDFVAMKLSGKTIPVMDETNAASLGLYRAGGFDLDAMHSAGIPTHRLPEVVLSGTQVGVHPAGFPVFVAIGDNQASFLGAVPSVRDTLLVNIGTGAQVSVWSDIAQNIPGWELRPFPGGGYLYVGATLGGGKSYALLAQFFRAVCRTFAGVEPVDLYAQMEELALNDASVGATPPLRVEPKFFGTRSNPSVRGSISNISAANLTPVALIQGWVEGMAHELANLYSGLPREVTCSVNKGMASGNGVRKNPQLRAALERQLNLPLQLSAYVEEAAVGAAVFTAHRTDFKRSASSRS